MWCLPFQLYVNIQLSDMRTKSTSASTNLAKFASQGYNESSDLIKLSRNSINNSESSEISSEVILAIAGVYN